MCLTKSLQAVSWLLCLFTLGSCTLIPPRHVRLKRASANIGRNIGDEGKNKICRDHFNSSDFIWVPVLNKCEPCTFACAKSTEPYCQACHAGSTTTQTTGKRSTPAPTAQPSTMAAPNVTDGPRPPPGYDENTSGDSAEGPPSSEAGKSDGGGNGESEHLGQGNVPWWVILLVLGLAIIFGILLVLVLLHHKKKQGAGEPEVQAEPNPETIPLSVQESQPAASSHPLDRDVGRVVARDGPTCDVHPQLESSSTEFQDQE
ncbi:uncharacterized protein LOC110980916 isoform X2 [Acanthaster planci]|nr:uncharacterized protein LOC110980916 isoform X2 [Acanthaster planci]